MSDRAVYIELERCAKLEIPARRGDVHPAVKLSPEMEDALRAIADSTSASRVGNISLHLISIASTYHVIKLLWAIIFLLAIILWRAW